MSKISLFTGIAAVALVIAPAAFAAPVEKVDGFVCPVLNATVGEHNPQAAAIGGGDYTVAGPDVRVPVNATNANGAGTPAGAHSKPGDSDYTAVWAIQ